jgi:hypothetical protein
VKVYLDVVAQQLDPLGPGEVLLRKLSDNTVLTRLGDKIELTVASHDAQRDRWILTARFS